MRAVAGSLVSSITFEVTVASSGDPEARSQRFSVAGRRESGGWRTTMQTTPGRLAQMPGAGPGVGRIEIAADGVVSSFLTDGKQVEPALLNAAARAELGTGAASLRSLVAGAEAALVRRARGGVTQNWLDQLVTDAPQRAADISALARMAQRSEGVAGSEVYVRDDGTSRIEATVDGATQQVREVRAWRAGREVMHVLNRYVTTSGGLAVKVHTEWRRPGEEGKPARTTTMTLSGVTIDGQEVK